jgi:uncharacterized protein YdeI (YjbR/CyaY-like superfamily)
VLAINRYSGSTGRWTESKPIDALIEPNDLISALEANGAIEWWKASAPSYCRNISRWIAAAKKPETRGKRVDKTSSRAAQQKRSHRYNDTGRKQKTMLFSCLT